MNDGNQRPPGHPPQQQPWMPQGSTQPWSPPQQGYGAAPSPYGQPSPYSPYAAPGMPEARVASAFGDAAGEHLRMTRGRYRATVYVFFAFLMQIGLVTALFALAASVAGAVGGFSDDVTTLLMLSLGGSGFVLGAALAYFVFRDRWKCIEAFSSRFCSGLMNLSLLYVPWVALVYANVRGVQKLSGR